MPTVDRKQYEAFLKELDSIPAEKDKCMMQLPYATEESANPLNDKLDKLESREKDLQRILSSMRQAEADEAQRQEKLAETLEVRRKADSEIETNKQVKAGKIVCSNCGGPVSARKCEYGRPGYRVTPTNTAGRWKMWWIPLECKNLECRILDRYYPDKPEESEGSE